MRTLPGFHARRLSVRAGLCLIFALSLAACSSGGGSSSSGTPSTTRASSPTTTTAAVASSTPQIRLAEQACPDAVKSPDYWNAIIRTQSGISQAAQVSCAYLIGQPVLQALILVRYQGSGRLADVYVYNDITAPMPAQLFKLQGLVKGDARISGYNTLITSEVDQASSLNKGRSTADTSADLFREFKWSSGAAAFVPVTFPAVYPDLTRFQAELAQQQVNSGHQAWRLSAVLTAQALAASLLKWGGGAPAALVSGGGQHDVDAVVDVKSKPAGGVRLAVTLSRLESNSNGGIWEATAVGSPGMTITTPSARDLLRSPTAVSGAGGPSTGVVDKVVVLDHLYTDIGHANAGARAFSTQVTYRSTFRGGTQEGVLAVYATSSASGAIEGAVLLKELLS